MKNKGFTLIEIMIGILITTSIIIVGFKALNSIMFGKVKLIEETNIEKESFRFSQKFFEEIKKGGTIDYEEYFNRMAINGKSSDIFEKGHFKKISNFGNSGTVNNGFYYCISPNGTKLEGDGCLTGSLNNQNKDQFGEQQRFGEYYLQFIDYNSNYDNDKGDEDGNGNIRGDDDDENMGSGPELFKNGKGVTELYLISANKKKRTIFRWKVIEDPNKPNSKTCDFSNQQNPTGDGCFGTIEFLKLEGKDWGFDHKQSTNDKGENDGIIDTWLIEKDFSELKNGNTTRVIAGNDIEKYFLPLFPNSINIKDFEVLLFPNADIEQSWKDTGIDISPYVKIKMTLTPSWKVKKRIKGKTAEFNLSTTINLTKLYSR